MLQFRKQFVLSRFFGIIGVSLILALFNGWLNPNAPPWSMEVLAEGEISLEGALALGNDVLWIDARSESDYASGHVPGALSLNEDDWDAMIGEMLTVWQPDLPTIVYCSSRQCQASHAVAERLKMEMGLEPVYVLHGGWEAWNAHSE